MAIIIEDEYEMVNGVMMPKRLKKKAPEEVSTNVIIKGLEQQPQQQPQQSQLNPQIQPQLKTKSWAQKLAQWAVAPPKQQTFSKAQWKDMSKRVKGVNRPVVGKYYVHEDSPKVASVKKSIKGYTGQVSKYLGGEIRTVYVKDKKTGMLVAKQIKTKGLQQRLAPSRILSAEKGAKRYERAMSGYRTTAMGVAGMLFPMSGAYKQVRTAGMSRGRPGRPAGVYKHVIPGVGPVHVYTYRKWLRSQKHKAQQAMSMREQAMAQAMMKRGLPPQMAYAQAEQFQQMRQQQAMEEAQAMQEMPQYQSQQQTQQMQPQPQQVPYQSQPQQVQQSAPITQARWNPFGPGPNNPFVNRRPQLGNMPQGQQGMQAPPGMKPVYDIFSGKTHYEQNRLGQERFVNDQSSFNRPDQLGFRRKQVQGGYY